MSRQWLVSTFICVAVVIAGIIIINMHINSTWYTKECATFCSAWDSSPDVIKRYESQFNNDQDTYNCICENGKAKIVRPVYVPECKQDSCAIPRQ